MCLCLCLCLCVVLAMSELILCMGIVLSFVSSYQGRRSDWAITMYVSYPRSSTYVCIFSDFSITIVC